MSRSWGGRKVTQARKAWARLLPLPCRHCGIPVTAADTWDLEHDPPRVLGGTRVVGVSHAACNRAAGARLAGARRRLGRVDLTW